MENYDYQIRTKKMNNLPIVTIILIVINVLVFLYMELTGSTEDTNFLYTHGAMYWPSIIDNGEWYRLITHMFVHAGPEHLLNNMFMLGILGYQIEREYGWFKYLLSYFVSGIGGAVLSSLVEMRMSEAAVSVGASGAIFGIFGIMLVMIFKNRRRMGQVSAPRLIILFVLMVFGNMEEGVDWMAHLGGALVGVVLAFLLYWPKNRENYFNL